jgi:hypothetical protein
VGEEAKLEKRRRGLGRKEEKKNDKEIRMRERGRGGGEDLGRATRTELAARRER